MRSLSQPTAADSERAEKAAATRARNLARRRWAIRTLAAQGEAFSEEAITALLEERFEGHLLFDRVWTPRPDRRWGWVSDDGYEIEWRPDDAEAGEVAGYYLYGDGHFGEYLGRGGKTGIIGAANERIGHTEGEGE